MQQFLNLHEDAQLEIDGDIGEKNSKTRKAVEAFQRKHMKPKDVDGIPGLHTIFVMKAIEDKENGDADASQ